MSESSINSQPLGLYVHWPFCVSKCPYCDFNSHVRESIDHNRWRDALLQELRFVGQQTQGRPLKSVFFGGGTPSLMEPSTVHAIIDELGNWWQIDSPEITLEANPNSVEIAKFREFRAAGINRVSLGIQSLNADALKFLGRAHNVSEGMRAIEIAADTFDRYSFDLIYARPNQTVKEWGEELKQALPLVRDHISLYQLTIEPGTAFYTAHARKDFTLPQAELAADLFDYTNEILASKGIERYEVSNHAAPGRECQHNMVYWRYQDYAGIGPGAHGRLSQGNKKYATKCHRAPETWLEHVQQVGHGQEERIELTQEEQLAECLMMGLRIQEGIHLPETTMGLLDKARLDTLIKEEYLILEGSNLRTTPEGLLRLNSVLTYLLTENSFTTI